MAGLPPLVSPPAVAGPPLLPEAIILLQAASLAPRRGNRSLRVKQRVSVEEDAVPHDDHGEKDG